MREIIDLCSRYGNPNDFEHITESQVQEAIASLNKGKTPDYHGVQVEHLLYGREELLKYLTLLVSSIFQLGRLTDVLKIGALTQIFEKKGSSSKAKNYRGDNHTSNRDEDRGGHTRIQPLIEENQNNLQRGFTRHSSPMNCSLILEEVIREYRDLTKPLYMAFLDVKSAFDVVSHESLLRKPFHIGIEGNTWTLIHSLHQDAESVIKWNGAY